MVNKELRLQPRSTLRSRSTAVRVLVIQQLSILLLCGLYLEDCCCYAFTLTPRIGTIRTATITPTLSRKGRQRTYTPFESIVNAQDTNTSTRTSTNTNTNAKRVNSSRLNFWKRDSDTDTTDINANANNIDANVNDAMIEQEQELIAAYPNDYLITDSTYLPSTFTRPTILQAMSNPRDALSISTLIIGFIVSTYNIRGIYNDQYQILELIAIALGILSTCAYIVQLVTGYLISDNVRRGTVDDATVNLYAAGYTGAVSWLALRTCNLSPGWLTNLDGVLPVGSVAVFVLSLWLPYVTLFEKQGEIQGSDREGNCNADDDGDSDGNGNGEGYWTRSMVAFARGFSIKDSKSDTETGSLREGQGTTTGILPELSSTELLRARGLLAIGVLGCVFAPDALSFTLGGQEWWDRVYALHPSQRNLESSTSLFALFSVEASMISHRVGKTGAACYRDIVPIFAFVCLVLGIFPCVCALHWLGNDISFFSFYRE